MNACLKAAGKMGEWRGGAEAERFRFGERTVGLEPGAEHLQERLVRPWDWLQHEKGLGNP